MTLAERHSVLRTCSFRFYPALRAGATVFFTGAAAALSQQMTLDPECRFTMDSPDSCSHVIACIGTETLFVGGGIGWDSGRLEGRLDTGAACIGDWDNAKGQARFACEDGTAGTVQYFRRDDPTGTAIGIGETEDGRTVEAWSGENVLDYIRRETREVVLQCGPATVPLA
ncbi:hypothetical protein N8I71_10720 [Roseibacterium sp. SDUM158016]|uniref:hypothetical protein n=1 Tax=Roseicyclus sediminis TaxID=2980997 RepID=UPI0021CE3176|nr:hypothetical protein [Roseibacterium sp. SDUM158016]MCU4653308.1 hypothetical protein [Roseibacterium sp. SDUM158016]